jgi:hypothetical protein
MSVTTRASKVSLTGAVLVVAGVLTAGCSAASSGAAAAGAPSSGSAAAATSSSPAAAGTGTGTEAATTGPGTAAATPSATPSPTGPAGSGGGAPACTTGDLKTATGDGGGGAAGSFYSVIDFTNTSSASCTLYGYPGVSLQGASAQIGAAATRTLTPGPGLVTLAPGATGHATLRMVDATVYPASECGLVTSAALLVYPPNQTQSVRIPFQGQGCSNSAVKILAVSAVTSGS